MVISRENEITFCMLMVVLILNLLNLFIGRITSFSLNSPLLPYTEPDEPINQILIVLDKVTPICSYYSNKVQDIIAKINDEFKKVDNRTVTFAVILNTPEQIVLAKFVEFSQELIDKISSVECDDKALVGHELPNLGYNVLWTDYPGYSTSAFEKDTYTVLVDYDKDHLGWTHTSKKLILYFGADIHSLDKYYLPRDDEYKHIRPFEFGKSKLGDYGTHGPDPVSGNFAYETLAPLHNFFLEKQTDIQRVLAIHAKHHHISIIAIHNDPQIECSNRLQSLKDSLDDSVRKIIDYRYRDGSLRRHFEHVPLCMSSFQFAIGYDKAIFISEKEDKILYQKTLELMKEYELDTSLLYQMLKRNNFMVVLNIDEIILNEEDFETRPPLRKIFSFWLRHAMHFKPYETISDYIPIGEKKKMWSKIELGGVDTSDWDFEEYMYTPLILRNKKHPRWNRLGSGSPHYLKIPKIEKPTTQQVQQLIVEHIKNYRLIDPLEGTEVMDLINRLYSQAVHNANHFMDQRWQNLSMDALNTPIYAEPIVVVNNNHVLPPYLRDKPESSYDETYKNLGCKHTSIIFKSKLSGFDKYSKTPIIDMDIEVETGCFRNSNTIIGNCIHASPYDYPFGLMSDLRYMRVLNIDDIYRLENNFKDLNTLLLRSGPTSHLLNSFYFGKSEFNKCKDYFINAMK